MSADVTETEYRVRGCVWEDGQGYALGWHLHKDLKIRESVMEITEWGGESKLRDRMGSVGCPHSFGEAGH